MTIREKHNLIFFRVIPIGSVSLMAAGFLISGWFYYVLFAFVSVLGYIEANRKCPNCKKPIGKYTMFYPAKCEYCEYSFDK
jgi:hypothetical protein